MKLNGFCYCIRSGFQNIFHRKLFSLVSIVTITASIFLFCMFFAVIRNVQHIAHQAETTVGITVFFNETVQEDRVREIMETLKGLSEVREIRYTSAQEAWDSFRRDYFNDNAVLAEAFAEDNPLAGSQSLELFLQDIDRQESMVARLKTYPEIRQINYSSTAISGLKSLNRIISLISVTIIAILLAVSVFLISNTISVAAQFRRRENEIMKLIGAGNLFIRLPFLVQGTMLGFVGALLPLIAIFFLYDRAADYVTLHFTGISTLFMPVPIGELFPQMVIAAMVLGVGVGFLVSFFTIRRSLRV